MLDTKLADVGVRCRVSHKACAGGITNMLRSTKGRARCALVGPQDGVVGYLWVQGHFTHGGVAFKCGGVPGEAGGLARAQHHQGDGPASSLVRVRMGTEQCAVVVSSLKLKP